MKLAIAVLALLCIGAHAHGIPNVKVEKTNEGVKSPEIIVKLPAVTVPVPRVEIPTINMPEIRLPKISMPGQGKSINLQVPTVDVQGLLNAALNKPMPSINMTNLAAMLAKPAMPSLNLDLSGLLSKPSVNISALASLLTMPNIDLSGLQTLMAARPTVKVTNAPDAAEIIMALVSKGSKDMNAVVGLINALATKPNITMPTVALNIPQINMPNIPMPEINLPQMPSIDLNTIVSVITALQGKREPAEIATQVVGVINSLMNAKPQFPALNLSIPRPVFPSFNFSTPQIDLSGLAAAAANLKPMPQFDLSGLATLALSKPMPQLNLALPDITALTNLALNKQHVNLTMPSVEALVNMATAKFNMLPSNMTLLPEVTAMLSMTQLPSVDLSAITGMLTKPNIDLSGLTALLQKPNVTLPDVNAILSAALAQHNANVQAFTSAATGVISALASKPNVQLPDLSGLFSKRSFNLTLPTFTMPTISMPNMDLSGVVSALLAKPANDLAALQNVVTALATKPNITMPNLSIDLSGLQALMASKPTMDLSSLTAMLDKNMTMSAPQMPSMQMPRMQMPSLDLSPDAILNLLNHAGLKAVQNVTLPSGQVVIDLANSAVAAKQSALNSAVGAVNSVAGQVQAAGQGVVNGAVGAVNSAVSAKQGAAKQVVKQLQGAQKQAQAKP